MNILVFKSFSYKPDVSNFFLFASHMCLVPDVPKKAFPLPFLQAVIDPFTSCRLATITHICFNFLTLSIYEKIHFYNFFSYICHILAAMHFHNP